MYYLSCDYAKLEERVLIINKTSAVGCSTLTSYLESRRAKSFREFITSLRGFAWPEEGNLTVKQLTLEIRSIYANV
jgi:hypothetical protein